jgi:hypothetical protein
MLYDHDWQVAAAYTYLDHLGASGFAWEFLRRNPEYRTAYSESLGGSQISERSARPWGLRFRGRPKPTFRPGPRRLATPPQSRYCHHHVSSG